MPSHKGNQQCTAADLRESRRGDDHQRREAEANRFAAGLLMPKPWFSRDMNRLGDADVAHVRVLAKQYGTSLEATSNRYCELTDDICAFVFAKDGVIRYVRPTSNFPRLSVRTGDPLPADCASLRAPACSPARCYGMVRIGRFGLAADGTRRETAKNSRTNDATKQRVPNLIIVHPARRGGKGRGRRNRKKLGSRIPTPLIELLMHPTFLVHNLYNEK